MGASLGSHDAIIIGAGHNGLVCAAYLAKAGLRVLVVERSDYVGGGCITQELLPGYRFSTFAYGAHGPGPKICSELGIPATAFDIASPDPTSVQLFPDGDRIVLWRDPERTREELARFGAGEAEGFDRYREFCGRAIRICEEFFYTAPPTWVELRRRWAAPDDAEALEVLLVGNLWEVICRYFQHGKVRIAFARADDVGPPDRNGSALAEFVEGAHAGLGVQNQCGMLEQGMGRITEVLAERVRYYGGVIRTSSPVRRVIVASEKAAGVELESGEIIKASHVISNADPKRTLLQMVDSEDAAPDQREQVQSISTAAGYMKFLATLNDFPRFKALRPEEIDDPKYAAVARILPSLEYMRSSWSDTQAGRLPRDYILSLQLPTAYWPSQAPEGKHIFGAWVRWAPARFNDGSTWETRWHEAETRIIEIVESYAPGFRKLIEWSRLYTPTDIERETGMTDGSIRHVDMTLDQMLDRRPLPGWANYQSPIPGLWLCGSGMHPCGTVTGAPGHNCAAALLELLGR